jgi:ubiquinone/menaquinone biosynthesis C-methylase UbiE
MDNLRMTNTFGPMEGPAARSAAQTNPGDSTLTSHEHERQIHQARHLKEHTAWLLRQARLLPGQQVLDIGSGLGDVALTAAEIVGPRGFVVGVDHSSVAVQAARERALAAGVSNVEFVIGDVANLASHREYDAIVGRLIVMHLTEITTVLANLRPHLRPGGLLALQECDLGQIATAPLCPYVERVKDWVIRAFTARGARVNAGRELHEYFVKSGYHPTGAVASQPTFPATSSVGVEWLAATARSLAADIVDLGLCSAAELEVEPLAARMVDEQREHQAIAFGPRLVGVWARI